MTTPLFLGKTRLHPGSGPVGGELIRLHGEPFYRIENYDRMRPFLMSVVSDSDQWMFLSSNGSLTAGRGNPDGAVFPYYTEDKIHDTAETTGARTILRVRAGSRRALWEPFSDRHRGSYRTRRSLFKSLPGHQVFFEEINFDLGLTFRYGWMHSDRFGLVRKAALENNSGASMTIELLDGVQNLVPPGLSSQFQLEKSNLIDAYKKAELIQPAGLGLFLLSSIPVDRPEPAEALRATAVWSAGLPRDTVLLSSGQLDAFRDGRSLRTEAEVRAERGAYFVGAQIRLRPRGGTEWVMAVEGGLGPSQVAALKSQLSQPRSLRRKVEQDVHRGSRELRRMVASADGLQVSARTLGDARHFNNVLFNIMRGGLFVGGPLLLTADLHAFVRRANNNLAARHARFFRRLGKSAPLRKVLDAARDSNDPNLERLCREYLPLTFSRRHGDPSRPWNRFSIPPRAPGGERVLNYEGNWRDIFQNWEALAASYPDFAPGMVCRFVNASTADGYNPYRITRDGFEWEVADPHDPWSHIGYWGDHQVVYLLRLLEIVERHDPAVLRSFLVRNIFSFANVPYRIRPFEQLLADPRNTVDFKSELDQVVRDRVQAAGTDGKLLWRRNGGVYLVNLTEKLLVLTLAKLANFVPEAGIWLNTQRPEWNDANNALVGPGASVVTVCALRRFLQFCLRLFGSLPDSAIPVSTEVADWFAATCRALNIIAARSRSKMTEDGRFQSLEILGRAGSRYREKIYRRGLDGKRAQLSRNRLLQFLRLALALADETIASNRAPDGLYHAYNLLKFGKGRALPIRRLYPMLEGQVAMLSSGSLSPEESLHILSTLRHSTLYRPDQRSYLLYPDRRLPAFVEKNNIPQLEVSRSRLLKTLLQDGDRLLIEKDEAGRFHFHAGLSNARELDLVLDRLSANGYAALVKNERQRIHQLYEKLFDHESFTGRSGTFFGYEGLGCIYWHMVSKLLLAAQETFFRALDSGASESTLSKLAGCYYDIRSGIGDYKSPAEYGVFPMDPYSHTPGHAGARQPGLTGQVKEDILCRWGELGVRIEQGRIQFRPALLRKKEFLSGPAKFDCVDVAGRECRLSLSRGSLAFTYCQVPVVYRLGRKSEVTAYLKQGSTRKTAGLTLDPENSRQVFQRSGKVRRLEVLIEADKLMRSGTRTANARE